MKIAHGRTLDQFRAMALLRLDATMRARRLALDPGQGLNDDIHAAKAAAAERFLLRSEKSPLLSGSGNFRAAAEAIIAKRDAAIEAVADLEVARQRLQASIRSATTRDQINSALSEIEEAV